MKRILFSILFLWISTATFGQRMDWSYLTSFPQLPITYVDDTKLTYETPDGLLKVEYELVSINGDNILYYDIQLSPLPGDPVTEFHYWGYSEGSIYGPWLVTSFWDDLDGSPLSGSVVLDQGDPEDFNLAVSVTTSSNLEYYFGFFTTYYPN